MDINIDTAAFLAGLAQLGHDVSIGSPATEKAMDRVGGVALFSVQRKKKRTYARKIPTVAQYNAAQRKKRVEAKAAPEKALSKESKEKVKADPNAAKKERKKPAKRDGSAPAWTRSGDYASDTKVVKSAPGERQVKSVGNSEKYEETLATLPTGPDGVLRRNDAGGDALPEIQNQVQATFETALVAELSALKS